MSENSAGREPEFWTCDDEPEEVWCDSISEAVAAWADKVDDPLPETVEVDGYAPVEAPKPEDYSDIIETLLERIDENGFGNPDEYTKPTEGMRAAALTFVRAVLAEYHVWSCTRVATRTVRVADYYDTAARGESPEVKP